MLDLVEENLERSQEKFTFIAESGLYEFKVNLFRLINAGATFKRLVNQVLCKGLCR